MSRISTERLRILLSDMGLEPRADSDGRIYNVLEADDDFAHDVVFVYSTDESGWFGIEAVADGFDLCPENIGMALALVNSFNSSAKLPKAFVKSDRIKFEQWLPLDDAVSDGYLRECIGLMLRMTWNFYIVAKNQL